MAQYESDATAMDKSMSIDSSGVSNFTEATLSGLIGNEIVVATTQNKSNYNYKALATFPRRCSVANISLIDPKPHSTTVATSFEAFLAIIIVLTAIVVTTEATTSSQFGARDTSAATVTSTETETETATTLIVEAVATPESSPTRKSSSLSKDLERPVAFSTQTSGYFASFAAPPLSASASDSFVSSRAETLGAGTGYRGLAEIELLCAKFKPKGKNLVDDDCANEDSGGELEERGGGSGKGSGCECGCGKRKAKELGEGRVKKRDENVSMRIERKLLPKPLDPLSTFSHSDPSQTEERASSYLLRPGEDELVRLTLVRATTNKYQIEAESGDVKLEKERDSDKQLKEASEGNYSTNENYYKKTLKEASSELLLPVLGYYVSLKKDRTKEDNGNFHFGPQLPAPLEALLFSIIKKSHHNFGSKFQIVERNKLRSQITHHSEPTLKSAINNISETETETDRSTVRRETISGQKNDRLKEKKKAHIIETSVDRFKYSPEIYLINLIQRKKNNFENSQFISSKSIVTTSRNKIRRSSEGSQISDYLEKAPNIRSRRDTKLDRVGTLVPSIITFLLSSNQFQFQQQQPATVTATTLLTTATSASNSIRINPFDQADHDRMNEDLVELLAQFYAHTQELQDKLEHLLYLSKFQKQDKLGELERIFEGDLNNFEKLGKNLGGTNKSVKNDSSELNSNQKIKPVNKISFAKLNESENSSDNLQDSKLIEIIKMKIGADEESLLKWLRQKQEKFSSLKNATFELLNEPPNRTINVCQDGPKILVMPNVSDIFYCYTSEQWVEKLWSDLRLSAFHYPIIILNILIFLFGTNGNIFVCLSVYRNHQLRNVTNYFIVNLAFADFLVILICLPATVVWDLSLTWFFGTIPCKLIMFLQDVSISVSVLTLTAISIDRYYAVCYPLKFKSSLNQAKRIIVLIWIVSLILMAPDLFYLSAKYSQELSEAGLDTVLYSDCNYDWSERSSRIFQFVKTILLYLLPFILMLCAHYKIMVTLRAASQSAQNQLTATIKENEDGVEFQEIEAVDEKASSGRNVCEEIYDYAAGRVQEEQKGNSKAKHNKINAHFRSLATSPPTPLLKQIRFYQTHSSNIDMFHATNNSQQSSSDSRYNIKVETNSRDSSNIGWFHKFLLRFSGPNSNRSLSLATAPIPGTSSNTLNSNEARGGVSSYGLIGPTSSNRNNNKQSRKASTTGATTTTNNQSSQLLVTMHNKSKLDSRKAAAKMLMTIVVMFGICYLPVHLINFLRQFIDNIPQTDFTSTISMLSHCACYLNSAVNPIIYNHMNSIFRAEFKKFLSCLYCWKKPDAKGVNKMANDKSGFRQTTHNESGNIKLKQLNLTSQRRSPGLVHQIAISDNDEIVHLRNDRDNNQVYNGESTRMTDIF